MLRFNVTYEVWAPEDTEIGETNDRGFIGEDMTLRDALIAVQNTRTAHVGGVECIEASASDVDYARWVTVYNGAEYLTGARELCSLHFPEHMTASSKRRVCRLLGA